MLHVSRVRHLRDCVLRLEFDNGLTRDVDLRDELHGEIFEPLRDPEFFRRVAINPDTRTIEWPNGADFSPEFLFATGTAVDPVGSRSPRG